MKRNLLLTGVIALFSLLNVQTANAETFKQFINNLAKGSTATFDGDLYVTYATPDYGYLWIQDDTYGISVSSYGLDLSTGDKLQNVSFSRPQWGVTYSCKTFDKVATGQSPAIQEIAFRELATYKNMLVTVKDVEFEDAGYLFQPSTGGGMSVQEATSHGQSGLIQPFECNLANAQIPAKANVTGIVRQDGDNYYLSPRSASDIEVLEEGGQVKDMDLAHFIKTLSLGAPAVYEGEILITYVQTESNIVTVIFQDNSAAHYFLTTATELKAGDIIKDVTILKRQADSFLHIQDYTLVSQNNPIEPVEIQYSDLYTDSPYSFMMVKVKDMNIQTDGVELMQQNARYKIYPDGAIASLPCFSTEYCLDLAGQPLPKRADITGILAFGYIVRPTTPAMLEGQGAPVVEYKKVDNIAAFKALGNTNLAIITGELEVTYSSIIKNFGKFFVQDATGALEARANGICFDDLREGSIIKNVAFSCTTNAGTFPTITNAGDNKPEVVSTDNDFAAEPITTGDFSSASKERLNNRLVEYRAVDFEFEYEETPTDHFFTYAGQYQVRGENNKLADIYPFENAIDGEVIPRGTVNVKGIAQYDTTYAKYTVRPRKLNDIIKSTKVEGLNTETEKAVYTITGVKVSDKANAETLGNLTPGLYIVGGKKVVIK